MKPYLFGSLRTFSTFTISALLIFLTASLAKAQVACNDSGCIAYRMWIVNQNWSGFLNEWGSDNGRESTNLCAPSSVFMATRAITDSGVLVKKGTRVWALGTNDDIFGIPYIAHNIIYTSVTQGTTTSNLINGVMSLIQDYAYSTRAEWVRTTDSGAINAQTVSNVMQRGGVPTLTYGHYYQDCRMSATGDRLYCTYQRKGGHTMAVQGWNSNGSQTYVTVYDPAGARIYDVGFGYFNDQRPTDQLPITHQFGGWVSRTRTYFIKSGASGYYGVPETLTAMGIK